MSKIEIDEDLAKEIAKFLMVAEVPTIQMGRLWVWVQALAPATKLDRRG